jgi:hypothetical protein
VLETAGYPNESAVTQQAAKDTDYDLAPQTLSSGGDGICSGVRAGGDRLSARSGSLSEPPGLVEASIPRRGSPSGGSSRYSADHIQAQRR